MKTLLSIFIFSFFIFHCEAQQYWHRVKNGLGAIGAGESVNALLYDSIDNKLYTTGEFSLMNDSIGCGGVAMWDGGNWITNNFTGAMGKGSGLALFNGIVYYSLSNGFVDYYNGSWHNAGNFNDAVYCLCVYHNKLYAGGSFTNVNGTQARGIACYDGTNWSEPDGGIWCTQFSGAEVNAMCVWNDKLIVGGIFDQAGGAFHNSIAAWNDTTGWLDLNGGVTYTSPTNVAFVNAVCVHDSDLIVGGKISHGGGTIAATDICRFDGNNWYALGSGITGGDVYSLLSWDSTLYIGGDFAYCGGVQNTHWIGKWDGINYHPVGDSLQGIIYTLCVYDSVLYAGGFIPLINHHSVNNIARLLDYPDTFLIDTTGIGKLIVADKQLIIYPNPATEKLTIELNSNCSNCKLEIINIFGEKILTQTIQKNKTEIDLSQLQQGIYFLSVQMGNVNMQVSKFVKE